MTTAGEVVHLVDVTSGSAATLTPAHGTWHVCEGGPEQLWTRIETVLNDYDAAGQPGVETFRLSISPSGQVLRHERMPEISLLRV